MGLPHHGEQDLRHCNGRELAMRAVTMSDVQPGSRVRILATGGMGTVLAVGQSGTYANVREDVPTSEFSSVHGYVNLETAQLAAATEGN